MSRHQVRLLLCSAASVALIVGALLVLDWFRIDFEGTQLTIGARSGRVCVAGSGCKSVGLAGVGTYRVLAAGAFWNGLLLALLVLAQCGMSLFSGAASALASRTGYTIGSITFLCAFGAGYLFSPDPPSELDVMGLVVERTFAPLMLLAGSLLGVLAVRYAQLEEVSDEVAEYKPIVIAKEIADPGLAAGAPSGPSVRARAPSDSGVRSRTPSQQVERIPLPGDRTKAPSEPPLVARTKSPSQPPLVARTSSSQPPVVARTASASQPPAVARTTSSQPPAVARTTSSQPPAVARTTSSQPPAVARTTSSQPPVVARTTSPSQPPVVARTKSPSQPPRVRAGSEPPHDALPDLPARARTSSSGPIDLAARLSGAPISVAIKPPLPEPIPVPPDQIPVAPESGLVIRKRTPSAGPISPHQIPVSQDSGLVIRKKTASAAPAPATPPAFGTAESPRGPSGITPPGAMPSIALRDVDPDIDNPYAKPVQSQLPANPEQDDAMSGLAIAGEPAVSRAFTPPDKPPALRGKLKYAVNMATLTSLGITGQREDGTTKHVGWDDIIGIIARRLPAETPYDGITFVDLVSNAGSTLRILPWTRLDGAPVRGEGEERVRAVVQLIAARCLDAKLDSFTKVFADGAGHAAQLPSAKTLAAHDDRLA